MNSMRKNSEISMATALRDPKPNGSEDKGKTVFRGPEFAKKGGWIRQPPLTP